MIDLRLPCREGNPDDWFISKDGKQFPSDDLVPDMEERLDVELPEWREMEERDEEGMAAVQKAESRILVDAKISAVGRRRRAKEACGSCLLRTRCFQMALDEGHLHGTWGGYYEEELKDIRSKMGAE